MFIVEVELSINGHGNVFVKVFSIKIELYDSFPFQKKNVSSENIAYLVICLAPVAPTALKMTNVEISDLTAEIDLWPAEQRNGPIR